MNLNNNKICAFKILTKKVKELEELINENISLILIETTYSELKSLRDNSQLIPGCWYRITDYECTTSQANTKSAGHKFDILVLATDVNTLSEEARAIERDYEGVYVDDGDHCIYTGRKVTVHFSDVTKELYLWQAEEYSPYQGWYSELSLEELKSLTQEQLSQTLWVWVIDEVTVLSENEISTLGAYIDNVTSFDSVGGNYSFDSYFSKCNLNAWKIWYCLDNDTSRFAWACNYLYPTYISIPYILNGEHLEFQGIKEFNGIPELFYGTPEQSERYSEDAAANMGWILRDYASGRSLAYTNRNTWTEKLDDSEISVVLIYNNEFDEGIPLQTENLSPESIVDEGKGVISRMIDEWNNDCPYDFKNIMYLTPDPYPYNIGGKYVYTFTWYISDGLICDATVETPGASNKTLGNIIKPNYESSERLYYLNNIKLILCAAYDTTDFESCYNTFGWYCRDITMFNNNWSNVFGDYCNNILLGDGNRNNVFENGCYKIGLEQTNESNFYSIDSCYFGENSNNIINTTHQNYRNFHIMVGVHNIIISDAGTFSNMWCGYDSDNNIRWWNPADPSGT